MNTDQQLNQLVCDLPLMWVDDEEGPLVCRWCRQTIAEEPAEAATGLDARQAAKIAHFWGKHWRPDARECRLVEYQKVSYFIDYRCEECGYFIGFDDKWGEPDPTQAELVHRHVCPRVLTNTLSL